MLGIVGESGSGKSVTMMSVMRLIIDPNAVFEGEVIYKGRDLMKLGQDAMREVRGAEIAMIFQDPMTSLNPVYRVGWQIAEQIREHEGSTKAQARKNRAIELLGAVGIPNPEQRVNDYPHQFSGGMRQRVMIAMALSCNPDLLIADEPTTALDVTIQAQILELIGRLRPTSAPRSCSSPTTWGWSPTSPTGSWSCTRAGSSSAGRSATSSTTPSTRTRGGCSARSRAWTGRSPSG